MRSASLELRVLIALVLMFVLGFCSLVLYVYGTRDELRRSVMFIQAGEIVAGFTADSDPGLLPTHYAGGELSYTLYSADGEPIWYSDNLQRPRRLRQATMQDELRFFRPHVRSGQVINVPVRLPDGSVLMVAKEDTLEREQIGALLRVRMARGLILLLPFCLLAGCLIFWLLRWTLKPVRQAATMAADIDAGNPGQRLPVQSLPREIQPLTSAVNLALERLATALETERRFVADAAHELRTPLTILDLRLQKYRAEGKVDWAPIEKDMQTIRRMIHQMLALAREEQLGSTQQAAKATASVSRIVREAVALMVPLYEAQDRTIQVALEEDALRVYGEPDLLRDAISNVLENALLHGQGQVSLWLRKGESTEILLDVEDEGAGVPPEQQEDMFLRFRTGSQGSRGSGLGLALVRQTLRNTGGEASFVSAHPCVLRLRFVAAVDTPRKGSVGSGTG